MLALLRAGCVWLGLTALLAAGCGPTATTGGVPPPGKAPTDGKPPPADGKQPQPPKRDPG
jgi:hypothetical protein